VACEGNAKLLALDLRSGRTTAPQTVGDTPDVLAYDAALHQLYVAAETGTLTIFHAEGMTLRKVAEGFAGPNAHTVAVDAATHQVFLPLADENGRPVLRVMAPEGT
jgi:DNA-binding beta-propeller fold protein YncE